MKKMDDKEFAALTNEQCFDKTAKDPKTGQIYFDETMARASIGIITPTETSVHGGQVLYKFGSLAAQSSNLNGSYSTGGGTAFSPWWFDQTNFKIIMKRHLEAKGELGLGYAARSAGAVPFKWQGAKYPSTMDYLVKAQIGRNLKALTGRGSRQEATVANGMRFVFDGWKEVRQLFIPGLNASELHVLSSSPINSHNPDPALL